MQENTNGTWPPFDVKISGNVFDKEVFVRGGSTNKAERITITDNVFLTRSIFATSNLDSYSLVKNNKFNDVESAVKFQYNPGSIADGASLSTTFTVNGAVLGDYITVSYKYNFLGITAFAYVSADDTVTVVFTNNTGNAVDLPNTGSNFIFVEPNFNG